MEDGGGGGRKAEKGDRVKGTGPREKAGGGKAADVAGGAGSGSAIILGSLDTLASVASRVTLSSYHALVRASLRRALECGTWRSYACWQCAGVDALGRPHNVDQVCIVLQPAAARALQELSAAARHDKSIRGSDTAAGGDAVVVAPPLFGSEAALMHHLSSEHELTLGGMRVGDITDRLRRCPQEVLPAKPSQQMLDALLGVRGMGMMGRGGLGGLGRLSRHRLAWRDDLPPPFRSGLPRPHVHVCPLLTLAHSPHMFLASDGIAASPPPPQVRALALLDIAAAVRSGSVPSAARPGGSSGLSRGEDDDVGQGRPIDARPACRPPLFSWETLFPPTEEDPAGKLRLPSDGDLAFFAEALKAAARAADRRAAEKASCAKHNARSWLAPVEALLPSAAASGAGGGASGGEGAAWSGASASAPDGGSATTGHSDGDREHRAREAADAATLSSRVMAAACRILSRGADAATKLLAPQAAAPQGEAATVARLRAARAAVLLENLVGSIHGKHLRAFLREEAAEARAAGAAPPAASRSSAALDAVEAASTALASAWAEEEAPQADQESFSWTGVSGGSMAPFLFSNMWLDAASGVGASFERVSSCPPLTRALP